MSTKVILFCIFQNFSFFIVADLSVCALTVNTDKLITVDTVQYNIFIAELSIFSIPVPIIYLIICPNKRILLGHYCQKILLHCAEK
jgi:hypothetical protein